MRLKNIQRIHSNLQRQVPSWTRSLQSWIKRRASGLLWQPRQINTTRYVDPKEIDIQMTWRWRIILTRWDILWIILWVLIPAGEE